MFEFSVGLNKPKNVFSPGHRIRMNIVPMFLMVFIPWGIFIFATVRMFPRDFSGEPISVDTLLERAKTSRQTWSNPQRWAWHIGPQMVLVTSRGSYGLAKGP